MQAQKLAIPQQDLLLTHFMVVSDQDRSREFYRTVLGRRWCTSALP
jgi:hypothetical protein